MTTLQPAACSRATPASKRAARISTSVPRRMSLPPAATLTRSGAMSTARGSCSAMTSASSLPRTARFAYRNPGTRSARTAATRSAQPRNPPSGSGSLSPSVKLSPMATKEPMSRVRSRSRIHPMMPLRISRLDPVGGRGGAAGRLRAAGRGAGRLGAMAEVVPYIEVPTPAFLFDLDGTLIDSVYQHVIAWRAALAGIGIDLSVWRIHRRIGMSGGLFVHALLRETGRSLSKADIELLQEAHAAEYRAQMDSVRPLPGARELLGALTDAGVRWAIATSGRSATARPALGLLGLGEDTPMVTRDMVRHAKPDPDLFLAAAAELGVDPRNTMVVGDSVWDLLAARRSGSGSCPADTGGRNSSGLGPTGCTPTRPRCSPGSTSSGSGQTDRFGVRAD